MDTRTRTTRIPASVAFGVVLLGLGDFPLGRCGAEETPASPAVTVPERVSFFRQVRPILQQHCQGCHQPAKASGKLVLTSHADLLKGGRDGPGVVPGKPDESVLLREVTSQDGKPPKMPKGSEPLGAALVETLDRWIAEGASDDSPVSVKAQYSAESPPVYTLPPVITSLDFSPDGTLLAVSGYHEVLLHGFQAGGSGAPAVQLAARLVGLSERIESAVFSPDGKFLAVTGGSPGRLGEVQIWELEERKLRLSVPVTYDTVYGASWSPDGSIVAFGCADNTLRAIDAKTGKEVLFQGAHDDWVLGTVFSTDASHLISVSRDRSVKLVQVKTQQFMDNITSITPGALKGGLKAVDRHPKKDEVLIAGADGVPKIYQVYRTKPRQIGDDFNLVRKFDALPGRLNAARYQRDASRIVVGSSYNGRGEVRVYLEADAKLVWKFEAPGAVYAVVFCPDGKWVAAGGFDGKVWLLDEAGKLVGEFVPVPVSLSVPVPAPAPAPAPDSSARR
jgi:WD40 repeat protein